MFEKRKQRHKDAQQKAVIAEWEGRYKEVQELIALVNRGPNFNSQSVVLKRDEGVIAEVTKAHLIEQVRGKGTYTGRNKGVSIPIGTVGGRSVRYRVGATKGHYVQAPPHPASTDVGTLVITNKRVLFIGAAKTVECLLTKVVAMSMEDGVLTVSVSNRQKPSSFSVGNSLTEWLGVRVNIALAFFNEDAASALRELQRSLAQMESSKPEESLRLS